MPEERLLILGGLRPKDLEQDVRPEHVETQCTECKSKLYLWELHTEYEAQPHDRLYPMCTDCFTTTLQADENRDKLDDIYILAGDDLGVITLRQFALYITIKKMMKTT
jgi:hypothetical protein